MCEVQIETRTFCSCGSGDLLIFARFNGSKLVHSRTLCHASLDRVKWFNVVFAPYTINSR